MRAKNRSLLKARKKKNSEINQPECSNLLIPDFPADALPSFRNYLNPGNQVVSNLAIRSFGTKRKKIGFGRPTYLSLSNGYVRDNHNVAALLNRVTSPS